MDRCSRPVLLFVGPNGVGKSTLITELISRGGLGEFSHIRGSALLMEWCGVTSYVQLASLPDAYKDEMTQRGMMGVVQTAASTTGPTLLIDAHMFHFRRGEARPCIQEWMREVGGIISLTAHPRQVYRRIMADCESGLRERDIFAPSLNDTEKIRLLGQFLETSNTFSRSFAQLNQVPYLAVNNGGKSISRAAAQVLGFYRTLSDSVASAAILSESA